MDNRTGPYYTVALAIQSSTPDARDALHLNHVHYIGVLPRNPNQEQEDEIHDLEGLF
jgi:hypothetical protein